VRGFAVKFYTIPRQPSTLQGGGGHVRGGAAALNCQVRDMRSLRQTRSRSARVRWRQTSNAGGIKHYRPAAGAGGGQIAGGQILGDSPDDVSLSVLE